MARVIRAAVFLRGGGAYCPFQSAMAIRPIPVLGLDSSWQQVITYAAASGWQWGRDIALTYGPLGFTWNAFYLEPLLEQVLFVKKLFVAALVVGVVGMLGTYAHTSGR